MCENFLISYLSKINSLFGVFSWGMQNKAVLVVHLHLKADCLDQKEHSLSSW